jgi:acetoin utilization deacetylase AcuC-like enzyme
VTDPHRALQLTTYSFQRVVRHILGLAGGIPMLLLGGGGYNPVSTAKHFTLLTACILDQTLDEEIPVEAEYWEELERDGGIHVGWDTPLTEEGKKMGEKYCTTFQEILTNKKIEK